MHFKFQAKPSFSGTRAPGRQLLKQALKRGAPPFGAPDAIDFRLRVLPATEPARMKI
jgi:hypothetical protein